MTDVIETLARALLDEASHVCMSGNLIGVSASARRRKKATALLDQIEAGYSARVERLRKALVWIANKAEQEWATPDGMPPPDVKALCDHARNTLETEGLNLD